MSMIRRLLFILFVSSPLFADVTYNGGATFSGQVTASTLTASNLSSGQCVQTTTGGQLTVTGAACLTNGNSIQNTSSLQSGATFYTSSGTAVNFTGTTTNADTVNINSNANFKGNAAANFKSLTGTNAFIQNPSISQSQIQLTASAGVGINTSPSTNADLSLSSFTTSSGTVTTQLDLNYIPTSYVLYSTTAEKVTGSSNLSEITTANTTNGFGTNYQSVLYSSSSIESSGPNVGIASFIQGNGGTSTDLVSLYGNSTATTGITNSYGLYSRANGGTNNYGVYGRGGISSNNNYGLYGIATSNAVSGSPINYGVYATASNGPGGVSTNYALYADGFNGATSYGVYVNRGQSVFNDSVTVNSPITASGISVSSGIVNSKGVTISNTIAYRLPTIQYFSSATVFVDTNTSIANTTTVMFPDGSTRTVTSVPSNFDTGRSVQITSTASWTSSDKSGLLNPKTMQANGYFINFYAVKSQDVSNSFVVVGDTTPPTSQSILNAVYGTNGWIYLGVDTYYKNNASTVQFQKFKYSGNFVDWTMDTTLAGLGSSKGGLAYIPQVALNVSSSVVYTAGPNIQGQQITPQFTTCSMIPQWHIVTTEDLELSDSSNSNVYYESGNMAFTGASNHRPTVIHDVTNGFTVNHSVSNASNQEELEIGGCWDNALLNGIMGGVY